MKQAYQTPSTQAGGLLCEYTEGSSIGVRSPRAMRLQVGKLPSCYGTRHLSDLEKLFKLDVGSWLPPASAAKPTNSPSELWLGQTNLGIQRLETGFHSPAKQREHVCKKSYEIQDR